MGSEARARLGLLGLATATLLSFNQLFDQQDFAGPALLGMMAALGVTLVCRRTGLWPSTTLALSLFLLLGYLCLVFQAPETFYGLPTLSAVRGLGSSIATAYEHSRVDFAPVPLRAGYAVLTTAAMWILVTVAEVAAFRWRRPIAATVPAIALFALVQIVGTQQGSIFYLLLFLIMLFTFWALDSSHRLRAWGPPARVIEGRRSFQPPPVASGLARRMAASCVAAALVMPFFMPAIEDGLVSWRTKAGEGAIGVGAGTGGGGSRIDPLVSLVPQLINQTERELFRVRADRPEYWRLMTLTRFDGENWTRGSVGQLPIDPSGLTPFMSRAPGQRIREEFTISTLEGHELPLAGMPRTVVGSAELEGKLYIDPASTDLTLNGVIEPGMTYAVEATVPRASFEDLQATEVAAPETPQYVETPRLSPAVRELSAQWTRGAQTDVEKLVAIQSRLRAFDYSLELDQPTSADYLEEFLLETRVGYCQQFATAFALLARDLGFPTRVVVGFLPGQTDIATPDDYVVTGNDTHAWPEVLFEGYGWIRFEPTPRQEASAPLYTVEGVDEPTTIAGAEAPTGSRGDGGGDGPTGPEEAGNRALDPAARRAQRDARAAAEAERINQQWRQTFGRIAAALTMAALLFLIGVPLVKALTIRRRYRRARDARSLAAAAFAEFEQAATDLVTSRRVGESATRYAARVSKMAVVPDAQPLRLASIYDAAEYAPADIPDQVAREARRLSRLVKGRLWATAGWWQRAKALWSPASLLPARPRPPAGRPALRRLASLGRS